MSKLIEVAADGIEGTAWVPESALPQMPAWQPVKAKRPVRSKPANEPDQPDQQ